MVRRDLSGAYGDRREDIEMGWLQLIGLGLVALAALPFLLVWLAVTGILYRGKGLL